MAEGKHLGGLFHHRKVEEEGEEKLVEAASYSETPYQSTQSVGYGGGIKNDGEKSEGLGFGEENKGDDGYGKFGKTEGFSYGGENKNDEGKYEKTEGFGYGGDEKNEEGYGEYEKTDGLSYGGENKYDDGGDGKYGKVTEGFGYDGGNENEGYGKREKTEGFSYRGGNKNEGYEQEDKDQYENKEDVGEMYEKDDPEDKSRQKIEEAAGGYAYGRREKKGTEEEEERVGF